MQLWTNWKTKTSHLARDCHQLARVPEGVHWLELREGPADELVNQPIRYCSWCVGRYLIAGEAAGVELSAELHPPAPRADYVSPAPS